MTEDDEDDYDLDQANKIARLRNLAKVGADPLGANARLLLEAEATILELLLGRFSFRDGPKGHDALIAAYYAAAERLKQVEHLLAEMKEDQP
ncbi:hypothetical protein FBZ84_14021 [Azospirillum baldaniorum]|uniref:hypothetical protein n=1 Tax=Azospirillum baldaniorum TaxID=1064539 RepID=UPI00119F5095|nr:hypothetical protein [Azospirillum baldaniorum]TWA52126.1 hypothetical protein FBZ84_14021 [Azospirillum baldaniorum]